VVLHVSTTCFTVSGLTSYEDGVIILALLQETENVIFILLVSINFLKFKVDF
jgi:hypothetical protein